MGIINRERALYMATGIDNTGLYSGRREAMGIIKAMASQITSFDVFSGVGLSAATAFASAAKSSYEFEKEFQKNMLEVATISTQVSGSMTDFMNRVVSITQQIPVTAPEAAKALYQIVSAGHDGADGMKVLEVSARSAVGGLTDTATAADAITTLLNAYKLSADKAEQISDQLFTTVRLGKTDFGQLGRSIAQVAPIAAAYGVEIDQVLAAVATLTKQGTPTAQAMTQIRAAIVGVSKYLGDGAYNSRTFQEALEMVRQKAGGSEAKLREFVPEIEAVNGLLGLTGQNAREAASHLNEMGNSTGATEAAFKKMKDEVGNQLTLLSNNITAALRPMGAALLEEMSDVAQKFNEAFADGSIESSMKHLGDLIVIVTGALVGYKGSVVAVTAAKTLYKAVTDWIIKAKVAEASRIVLTGKAYAAEAAIMAKNTGAHVLLTNALKAQAAAALKNAAAMLTNPYVLAAAAVATLGYALYSYVTKATAAELAQKQLNEEYEKAVQEKQELTSKTESLIAKINSETESIYNQIKAYKELVKLFPELKGMTFEEFKAMPQSQQKSIIDNIADKKELEDAIRLHEMDLKRIQILKKQIEDTRNSIYNKRDDMWVKEIENLNEQLEITKKLATAHKAQIEEIKQTQWEANTPVEEKVKHYEKLKESLEAERRALYQQVEPSMVLKSSVEGMNAEWGKMPNLVDRIKLDILNKQLDETTGKIKSLTGKGDSSMLIVTKNKAHWEEQKKNATTALEAIDSRVQAMLKAGNKEGAKSFLVGDLKKTEKEADAILKTYTDSVSKLNEANNNLKVYDFSDKTKNDALKSQQELSRAILDSDLKLQEMRLSILEDGRKKRLKQSELEYQQQKAVIEKEYQDTVQKYKDQHKPVPNSVKTTYEARLGANNAAKVARDNKIDEDYTKERKEHEASLTAYMLSEESKRKKAIKERYDAEREWAKKQFAGENMTDAEYTNYLGRINTAETEESLQELLDKYQDYAAQRKDIEKQFNDEITTLNNSRTQENEAEVDRAIAEVQKKRKEALSHIDLSEFQEEIDWSSVFGNLDRVSTETLESLQQKIKNYLSKAGDSISKEDFKTVTDALNQMGEAMAERKPIEQLRTGYQDYKKACDEVAAAQKKVNDLEAKGDKTSAAYKDAVQELTNAQDQKRNSLVNMNQAVNSLGQQGQQVVQAGNNIVGMLTDLGVKVPESVAQTLDGVGQIMDGLASIDITKPFSIITSVTGIIGGIGKTIGGLFGAGNNKGKKDFERLQSATDKIAESQRVINSLIEKRIDLIKKATIAEQKNLSATTRHAIENQKAYNERQFQNLKGNWLLDKKGKHNNLTVEQLGINSIDELDEFLTSDRLLALQDQGYKVRDLDKWKEIVDSNNSLNDKLEELDELTAKNLTGITLDDAQNALDDFLKDADATMEDVAGSFEDYMRDAMLGLVKQNILNKAMEEWYNHFEESMKSGEGLDETEVKNLQQEYENAFTTAQEAYNNMLKVANISPESDSSTRQATEKAGIAASQDSVNEINGNFSALLISSNKTAEGVTSLRESMNYILEIQRAGWGEVRAIRDLTSQMRTHTEKISELSEAIASNTKRAATGIDTLNTKGLTLKR